MGFTFWAKRVALSVALAFAGGAIVEAMHLLFVVTVFGGLDEFLCGKHAPEDMWLLNLGVGAFFGSMLACTVSSFLAVLIAPAHFTDRATMRSWIMAATLAALAGCGAGGFATLLYPQYLSLEWTMITVLACGGLTGLAAAVLLRLRVNR